ncbi:unnamed protein product [Urochloa decumbens]|uniref:Knottins-like domain-containing protein n=1 Tax=Urochloa decumbens TaxID=240449 RepID=A0ABC9B3V7_9POAL
MAASSRKNVSAAVAVVVLLIIIATAGNAQEGDVCTHLSDTYRGFCWSGNGCDETCRHENLHTIFGMCDFHFPPRCLCYLPCQP